MIGMERLAVQRGGLNRYVAQLHASRAGRARLVAMGDGPADVHADRQSNPALKLLRFWWEIRRALPARTVEAHFVLYSLPVWLMRSSAKQVTVFFHGPWAAEGKVAAGRDGVVARWKFRVKHAVEGTHYRRADRCFTASSSFAANLVQDYDLLPSRVFPVGAGVDLETFHPKDRQPDGEGFIVVAARRLSRRMGLEDLIEAWARLGPGPADQLRVVGEGDLRTHLERLAESLGVQDRVCFLGGISDADLVREYQDATVSAVPSRSLEGFGLVALESLACGTPAVVTRVGGLIEHVGRHWPELVSEPCDPESLAQLLRRIRSGDIVLPDEVSCREFASRFTWNRVVQQIDDINDACEANASVDVAAVGNIPPETLRRWLAENHHASPSACIFVRSSSQSTDLNFGPGSVSTISCSRWFEVLRRSLRSRADAVVVDREVPWWLQQLLLLMFRRRVVLMPTEVER
jgi:glycosyltransferase involved in cell wall biosynthesis